MSFYVSTATFFLLHCDEWDRVVALPRHKFVTGATLLQLRSSVNRSTGYTPNMMMLGREIGLPAELMLGNPGNTGQPEGDQYVGELQTAIEGAHRVARETQTIPKTNEERLRCQGEGQRAKLGDLVYQLDTATVKGKTRKLSPSWKGPGVVIEK